MSRHSLRFLAVLLVASSTPSCGEPDPKTAAPFACSGSVQGCLNEFAGDYAGTYTGDTAGTWSATVSPAGALSGTAHNTQVDSTFGLTGTSDENGRLVFGTVSDGTAFQGQVAADFSVSGTWTLEGHSGTFSGKRVGGTDAGSGQTGAPTDHPTAQAAVETIFSRACDKLKSCFPDGFDAAYPAGVAACIEAAIATIPDTQRNTSAACTNADVATCAADTTAQTCPSSPSAFELPASCAGC